MRWESEGSSDNAVTDELTLVDTQMLNWTARRRRGTPSGGLLVNSLQSSPRDLIWQFHHRRHGLTVKVKVDRGTHRAEGLGSPGAHPLTSAVTLNYTCGSSEMPTIVANLWEQIAE